MSSLNTRASKARDTQPPNQLKIINDGIYQIVRRMWL